MKMTPKLESFVMHFGEMGSKWGFNRTVGQMYALLVVAEKPLTANEITDLLNISRGNVSMGIKELQSWQLVKQHHIPGDRKDYYSALGSMWDMAKRVFEERRKREIDPTLTVLRDMLMDSPANEAEAYAQQRLQEMHDLLETVTQWTQELQRLSPENLNTLMTLGQGVTKVIEMKDKILKKSQEQ